MERLTFTATGEYGRSIPVELILGLLEEIQRHMEAYEFKNIKSESYPAPRQPRTHCAQGHELTEANTIRNTEGFRECRTCKHARQKAARDLKRAAKRKEAA